jgi:hypothetical protein
MRLINTDGCRDCDRRIDREKSADELARKYGTPQRELSPCNDNYVQAGAPSGRDLKAECLINLPDVMENLGVILRRPIDPQRDTILLKRILRDIDSVFNDLDIVHDSIQQGFYKFHPLPTDINIPKESPVYPVYYPIFRFLRDVVEKKRVEGGIPRTHPRERE